VNVVVVVVLYNCLLSKSHTVQSLLAMPFNRTSKGFNVNVIIYDNGLDCPQELLSSREHIQYFASSVNEGLPVAYNYALKEAWETNAEWLLLLDQDTKLPADYFENLYEAVALHATDSKVVAAVPKMHYQDVFFSPSKVLYAGVMRPIERGFLGIYPKELFAIGSCSLLKVDFLREIGGFSQDYWLDSLDRWLYKKVHILKRRVLVTDIVVEHELSVMNFDKFISEARYENILKYESKFMINHCSFFENIIFRLRLFLRSIKLYLGSDNKNFALITAKHIFSLSNRDKV
jgi:GT2 family glycosyltransferase